MEHVTALRELAMVNDFSDAKCSLLGSKYVARLQDLELYAAHA